MKASERVVLARHGRTALNAEGRLRGLADPPLDGEGEAEADRLAAALADHGAVRVVCSPLQRALRTGQAIAARLGVDAVADDRFNDRDYGPWTGAPKSDVVDRFGSVDAAPGVESASAVLARARPALDAVLAESGGGPVVVVTHDAVLRPLLADLGADEASLVVPTGSWSETVRENGSWRVVAVDQQPSGSLPNLRSRPPER